MRQVFPFLENLLTLQLNGWNADSPQIASIVLDIWSKAIHMEITDYFNVDKLKLWMCITKTLFDMPLPPAFTEQLADWGKVHQSDELVEWKLKKAAMQIASRFMYHALGAAKSDLQFNCLQYFIDNYSVKFLESAYLTLVHYRQQHVSPGTLAAAVRYLFFALQVEKIYGLVLPQVESLLLDHLVPLLALNPKDHEYWQEDPVQYIYSKHTKTKDHNSVKNAAEELINMISKHEDLEGQLFVYRLVNFVSYCLANNVNPRDGNSPITPLEKEYLLYAFEAVADCIQHEAQILHKLESFFEAFLIPEFSSPHGVLQARACEVYQEMGGFVCYTNKNNFVKACQGICACLDSKYLPVQVAAAGSLNMILANAEAKELLRADLENILNRILGLMQKIDFDDLIVALEGIIEEFSDCLGPFTIQLVNGLSETYFNCKQSLVANRANSGEEEGSNDETAKASEACLDTINNILKANLNDQIYRAVSDKIFEVINVTILSDDDIAFGKCLSLLNVILYKCESLDNQLVFYFPMMCYLILGKPSLPLQMDISGFSDQIQTVINNVNTKKEWINDLSVTVGCFLNYMKKCGTNFLTGKDMYGIPFMDLIFGVIKRIGEESLRTNRFGNLIYSLRIIIGLLENFRDQIDGDLEKILAIVRELLTNCSKGQDELKSMLLQVIAMMFWYNPVTAVNLMRANHFLDELLEVWFGNLKLFASEHEKERELYGIAALLSLVPNDFPKVQRV